MGTHYLADKSEIRDKRKRAAGIVFAAKFKDGIEVEFLEEEEQVVEAEERVEGLDWEVGTAVG